MTYINMTGHTISFAGADGITLKFEGSPKEMAYLKRDPRIELDEVYGVQPYPAFGDEEAVPDEVIGLPSPKKGIIYIVPFNLLAFLAESGERTDLVADRHDSTMVGFCSRIVSVPGINSLIPGTGGYSYEKKKLKKFTSVSRLREWYQEYDTADMG